MPPPWRRGELCGVHGPQRHEGHLPSCQIIHMMIGILLKMLMSDQGGAAAAAAADDVNGGGLLYSDNDDDNVDDKE